uniref:Phospholipase n=1 Tax=Schistosoma mansoni TaxID=6183 RepID=A0A5K4ESG9_SCHMA
METISSPDVAGLDSTLKYERNRYNNANVFLPNTPIIIKVVHSCESQIIIDAGSQVQSKTGSLAGKQLPHGSLVLTNQSWYELRLKHGDFEWSVFRTLAELKSFHTSFMLQRALLSISNIRKDSRRKLNPFPPTFEFANDKRLYDRRVMLEKYIQSIIDVREYRETDLVLRLLEVSPLSFVNCSGRLKLKEDCVNKLPSYNYFNKCCCVSGICLQKRWLILKDSYFVYMKQHGDKVKAKDIDKSAKGKLRLAFSIELSGKNRSWRLCNIFLMDQNFAFKTRIAERSGQCQLKLYNSLGYLTSKQKLKELKNSNYSFYM